MFLISFTPYSEDGEDTLERQLDRRVIKQD